MSGHSHWSTIKHDKGVEDAKKSKAFTKMGRLITVAVKKGGGDPSSNPTLRTAIEKARKVNMTNDLIDRTIKKALGEGKDTIMEEAILEGYGPSGVGFLVEILTDNRNRTVSEIRNIFSRHGGNLGEAGSTSYIFNPDPRNPQFLIPLEDAETKERIKNLLDTLRENDDVQEVYANFSESV